MALSRREFGRIFTLGSLGALIAAPILSTPLGKPFEKEEVVSDKLVQNNDNSKRIVVYKSLEAGLADLTEVASTAKQEEAYAFIPDEQKWIEIGDSKGNDDIEMACYNGNCVGETGVGNDGYLETLFRTESDLRVYHTHTNATIRVLLNNLKQDFEAGRINSETAWKRMRLQHDLHSLVSTADIKYLLEQQRDYCQINPSGKLIIGAVSEDAVSEAKVTSEGIQWLNSMSGLKWFFTQDDMGKAFYRFGFGFDSSLSPDQNREWGAMQLSNNEITGQMVQVNYRRLNDNNSFKEFF